MVAMDSIEFMMFVCIPVILVPLLIAGLWGEFSKSDSAVRNRQEYRERYSNDDFEDSEQDYQLQREMSHYYRNENFDRQQGDR